MAIPVFYNRVKETTTTTGTGTLTLAGAVLGYQSFAAVGNGNLCYYCIESVDANGRPTGDWEVGLGTYSTTGPTLARSSPLASSAGGSAVNLSAGIKNVFLVSPSSNMVNWFEISNIIILEEQQTSGTSGGTFTSGAWRTRTLNTKVLDTGSDCTLSSNQFTLLEGNYELFARCPAGICNAHQARLQNITDASTISLGSNEYAGSILSVVTNSIINTVFKISSAKTFEIQHQCGTTGATTGFGAPGSFGTEVYTSVKIRRRPG